MKKIVLILGVMVLLSMITVQPSFSQEELCRTPTKIGGMCFMDGRTNRSNVRSSKSMYIENATNSRIYFKLSTDNKTWSSFSLFSSYFNRYYFSDEGVGYMYLDGTTYTIKYYNKYRIKKDGANIKLFIL
jgi:hypothetical protein